MVLEFNDKQLKLLDEIGFDFNVKKDLSDDEFLEIDRKVSDYFMSNGIDNDEVNAIGIVCESIMDILGEY